MPKNIINATLYELRWIWFGFCFVGSGKESGHLVILILLTKTGIEKEIAWFGFVHGVNRKASGKLLVRVPGTWMNRNPTGSARTMSFAFDNHTNQTAAAPFLQQPSSRQQFLTRRRSSILCGHSPVECSIRDARLRARMPEGGNGALTAQVCSVV